MISDEGVWGEDPLPKKMFELVPMECCIFHSNTQNISPDHVSVGYSFLSFQNISTKWIMSRLVIVFLSIYVVLHLGSINVLSLLAD